MLVSTGLFRESFNRPVDPGQVVELLMSAYGDELCISVYGPNDESQLQDGYLDPQANNGTNRVDIFVSGHEQQILLISRLDNLGKGASGAAIQNLNLMLGRPELEGLSH
jgi:N-acetyl-gamma-glutamyl-phosphate reductase